MNIQEYDIMNALTEKRFHSQRELSAYTGYSVGKVNSALKKLFISAYIDEDMNLSQKALCEIQKKKPKNAVILAAGYGMRMVPINVEMPKGLLEVHGEPLIERLILQLHDAEIYDIDIIVGFMKEQYEYLIDKFGVNLVFNADYSRKNNLHSLNRVVEKIGNTYIIPCDIWCRNNPFSKKEWYSWYMVTDAFSEESSVRINRKKELVSVKRNEDGNAMVGIAYMLESDAEKLKKNIREYSVKREYNQAFWEQALLEGDRYLVGPKEVSAEDVFEINTYEQLRELDDNSNQLQSDVIALIAEVLNCNEDESVEIRSLKKGMTNRSFQFRCRDKKYIMRIPGEGTDQMINRRQEYEVYEQLKGTELTDPVIYISPENGYKITEFVENARNCDSDNPEDVKICMDLLREFHNMNLKVEHTFDIFEQMEYYEKLRGAEPSAYRDYQDTKVKMYELKQYIDAQPKQISLTHIDANCDNFLLTKEKIYLIDWEYAGMQDIHVDIAMFAIYSMYDREKVDELINLYFQGQVDQKIRIKIYCYIAVCGFLWSNWCEYKRVCGVEFGEYSLRQYRYAKEYYHIVKEELEKGAIDDTDR